MHEQILILIQCQDSVGLVSRISHIVTRYGLNIITMREFVDESNKTFFVRVACAGHTTEMDELQREIAKNLPPHATVQVNRAKRKRIVVLVTKEHHCLSDLIVRHHFGTLQAEIVSVIGNYADLDAFVTKFDIPYHHIDHSDRSKAAFEADLADSIDQYSPDYIILAKFMRILSPEFVSRYSGKIINIHHSFLPAFIGANPYRQAYERGVKIIGATAHFVTDDLDEGPIIVQNTKSVDHSYDIQRMKTAGQEIEKAVLTRALQLVMEDRVMVSGNKTIVFKA